MLNLPQVRRRPTMRDPITPSPTFTAPTITGLDFGVPTRITPRIRIGAAHASLTTGVRIGEVGGEATGAGGSRYSHAPDVAPNSEPRRKSGLFRFATDTSSCLLQFDLCILKSHGWAA